VERPTAETIRGLSALPFADYGFGDGEEAPDKLDAQVASACAYVEWVTGWLIETTVPAPLEPLITDAVRMRTEQNVMVAQPENIETAGDIDLVQSFTAGSYSETRRDPQSVARGGQAGMGVINPWPALNALLWLLLGTTTQYPDAAVDARYDYWRQLLSGVNAPAWTAIEVDWSAYDHSPYGFSYGTPEPVVYPDGFDVA
jgi:hypothetical protein